MKRYLIFTMLLGACAGEFKPDLMDTGMGPTSSDGSTDTSDGSTGDETGSTTDDATGSTGDETDGSTGDTTGIPEGCGDGEAMGMEECDGLDLRGKECTGFVAPMNGNFHGGTLACNDDCTYDTSACTYCGDGEKNGSESCDDADLGTATCEAEGWDGGDLSCDDQCDFVESECANCEGDPAGPYGKPNEGCQGGISWSMNGTFWGVCGPGEGCENNADCDDPEFEICANQPVCDDTGGAAWCKFLCDDDSDCPSGMTCQESLGYGVICVWEY